MTKPERAVGIMILAAFIITLDITLVDQISEHLSAAVSELVKSLR